MAEHEEGRKAMKPMKEKKEDSRAHWMSLRATYRVKTSTKEETDEGRKKCVVEQVPWILPSTWNAVKGEY